MADPEAAPPSAAPSLTDALGGALASAIGRGRVVITPYPFGVQPGDYLRVTCVNSLQNVAIEVHGRLASPPSIAKPFRFQMTPTADRVATSKDFLLGDGLVTNLSVFAIGAAPAIGQTFIVVNLMRDAGPIAYQMGTLLADYVTGTQPIGWPGTPINDSISGGGYYRTILGANPANGTEISETVPAGARWEIVGINLSFFASATAATRRVILRFQTATDVFAVSMNPFGQGPSSTHVYLWAANLPIVDNANFGFHQAPLPVGLVLPAGGAWSTLTDSMQITDVYSSVKYQVREWLEVF